MKIKLIKILSTILIGCSLFAVPASAEWIQDSNGWWYTEDNSWATGWRYINGEWYYFKDDGYMVSSPYCNFSNSIGSYFPGTPIECNGDLYFFDKNGHMLHDCFVIQGSGGFQSWLDSNRNSIEKQYGNKYSGRYDLSQADLSYVPCLNGYTEDEAKEISDKIDLKLNIQYENIPDSNLNNVILGQTNTQSKIIKDTTTSKIVVGKYSESNKKMTGTEIRTYMINLQNKYDNTYSLLYFLGLY